MSSASGSAAQQDNNPNALLSRIIKRLDLKDGTSDFIKKHQEEARSAEASPEQTFLEVESNILAKLQSLGVLGLVKDDFLKMALKEGRQNFEESVSKGSKLHCRSFRQCLAIIQWGHRFQEAMFESILSDKALEELERVLEKPLSKDSLEFELLQTAIQTWRDVSTSPGYPYQRLNSEMEEIRLLVVLPCLDDSAIICCKLISSNKETQKNYVALSYCWGQKDDENPTRIELEGQSFDVTPNLYAALKRLRSHTTNLYLWVDALCINQTDTQERNDQVSRMKSIYQNAAMVLCFLGEEENQSSIAMEFFLDFEEAEDVVSWLRENWSEKSKPQMYALEALLKREYWKRVWIMQEIVLSRNVYICCGKYITSWSSLVHFLVPLSQGDFPETAADLQMVVKTAAQIWVIPLVSLWYKKRYGMRISLLEALVMSRRRNATLLHDYVYGVMGLLDVWAPEIDYETPAPIFYIVVATAAILMDMDGKNLDALSMCKGFDPDKKISDDTVRNIIQHGTKALVRNRGISKFDARGAVFEIIYQGYTFTEADSTGDSRVKEVTKALWVKAGLETLPSWVPRLDDNSIRASQYILLNRKRNTDDQASRGTLSDVHLALGGRELVIKGLILDQVSCVSSNISETKKLPTTFEDLMASSKRLSRDMFGPIKKDWRLWDAKVNNSHRWKVWDKRKDSGSSNPYGGLDNQKEAFIETNLIGSQISETVTKTLAREMITYQAGWTDSHSVYIASDSAEDISEILACSFENKFLMTERKFMGRGPKSIKERDLVCILYGGRVPFILRPWGEKFYLMGECYVHGVMNGEAMSMRDNGELEEREFVLM